MRDLLHGALCALLIATVACGGGDPPGGGSNGGTTDGGDTTDGTTGNGGTDGYVPNPNKPLIEALPGLWELVELNFPDGPAPVCCASKCDCTSTECAGVAPPGAHLEAPGLQCAAVEDNRVCAVMGCVTVDPTNPSCQYHGPDTAADGDLGPPGDACVWGFYPLFTTSPFILDGSTLQSDPPMGCPSPELPSPYFCTRVRGQVLDNGTRMEYTREEWTRPDRSDISPRTLVFRRVR